ncbi:MAG TPA: hypothetical protein ENN76_00970 [Euryarchaeota archaeon]|nr:hypothetical protein [Euryarchaeota archaeon]
MNERGSNHAEKPFIGIFAVHLMNSRLASYFFLSIMLGLLIGRIGGVLDYHLDNIHGYSVLGTEIHHYHYGLILLFLGALLLLFCGLKKTPLCLSGFGTGLVLDEFRLILQGPNLTSLEEAHFYFFDTFLDFVLFFMAFLFLLVVSFLHSRRFI